MINYTKVMQAILILLLIINVYALYLDYNLKKKSKLIKILVFIMSKCKNNATKIWKRKDEKSKNSLIIETLLNDVNYFSMFMLDREYNYTFINNRHKQDLIEGFNLKASKGDNIIKLMERYQEVYKIKYIEDFKENINRAFEGHVFTVWEKIGINGAEHYFMLEYVPLKSKNNSVNEVLIILLGATEYIKLYREVIKSKQNEENLHNEKSQFMAYITHELRTSINAITGLSDMLIKSELDEKQSKYINIINNSGKYLSKVLNDVLDLSKIESGKITILSNIFNLDNIIQSIDDIFYIEQKRKEIYIKYYIDPNIPKFLKGDELRVKQILTNLISNALKFTSKGEVKVNIFIDEDTNNVDEDTITLKFQVIDTGIGIGEKYINSIFDKYTQIEEYDRESSVKGTGLGLSISKQLIEIMGGKISVSSEENVGTKFVFSLPFNVIKEYHQLKTVTFRKSENEYNITILVADDDEVNQIIICSMIRAQSWACVAVKNGKEVLEELSRNKYDIILMDINMAVMNGIEAIKEIRKNKEWNHIPIIALTAATADECVEKMGEVQVEGYIYKPIDEKQLSSIIKSLLKIPLKDEIFLKEIYEYKEIENSFKRIEKIFDGNKKLVVELAYKVTNMLSQEKLNEVKRQIDENKFLEMQDEIHKIKGAISNFGLEEIIKFLDELNEYVILGDKDNLDKTLIKINEKIIVFKQKTIEYENS